MGVPREASKDTFKYLMYYVYILNIRLLKSGELGFFRKIENFEWEKIKIFIFEVTHYNNGYLIVQY